MRSDEDTSKPISMRMQPPLHHVATRLREHKVRIISLWKERVKLLIPGARSVDSSTLIDSLPDFLDDLAATLSKLSHDPAIAFDERELAREHGRNRVERTKYTLAQVHDEYRILRSVLFEILEDGDVSLTKSERDIILHALDIGVKSAASEYADIQLERALESSIVFDTMIASNPVGVALLDRELRFQKINPVLAALDGATVEAHLGKTIREVVPGIASQIEPIMRKVIDTGRSVTVEIPIEVPPEDPKLRWFLGTYYPVRSSEGELTGVGATVVDITALKDAERKLKENEEFRNTIFASSEDCFKVLSLSGDLLILAKESLAHLELEDASPLIGKSWVNVWTRSEDRKAATEAIRAAAAGGKGAFTGYSPTPSRKKLWWHVVITPIRGADGKPETLLAVSRDVTQLRQAEENTQRSEERLRLATSAARVGIWDLDLKSQKLIWSEEAAITMGFEASNKYLTYADFLSRVHPEDLARTKRENEVAIATGKQYAFEFRVILPDGQVRWVTGNGQAHYEEDGTPCRFVGTILDVTERKRTEDALRESEEKLNLALESAQMGTWQADLRTNLVTASPGALAMLGVTKTPNIFEAMVEKAFPEYRTEVRKVWEEAVARSTSYTHEFKILHSKDDVRWLLSRGTITRNKQSEPISFSGIIADITQLKETEQSLKQIVKHLNEERHLRERFTNTLTHDLRNPLGTAKMAAQLILRYRENETQRDRLIHKVVEALERVDQMISDLLDANKIKAGEKLPLNLNHCDLKSVASNALEELTLVHGDRFILKDEGPCEGYWSCESLRRVVENLANNAVKYGSQNTPITVTVGSSDTLAFLKVHNLGGELSPDEASRLFDLYRRSASAEASGTRGWGIGLTLVKGIVESHGGTITVESGAGEGTTFRIELPKDSRPLALNVDEFSGSGRTQ